jgi:hypothetical protein
MTLAASGLPCAAVLALLLVSRPAAAQVTVTVDPTLDAHAVSPLVYGMNFPSSTQITQGRIPIMRWGGNRTTRYNYQIDTDNTGSDYYFEDISTCLVPPCSPGDPKTNSQANAFLAQAQGSQVVALFTIPTMGYVAKPPPLYSHPFACGFPVSIVGPQDSVDPFDTNCGNGQHGGANVAAPDPTTTTSIAITPQWAHDWVAYLVGKFGPSNGRIIYELDNEPALWSSTHRDARSSPLGYDELWQRMQQYAVAILQADPTALIAGFEEWGWPNYFCSAVDTAAGGCGPSSPDRAAHGGEDLTSWILDQAAAYERNNGRRILHYLDLHYYPQGGTPPQTVRSLWDPTYTDPSWINAVIELLPRMRSWVGTHYPGTKIGISEYNWVNLSSSANNTALAAITYAEVLGTFGREQLDYATVWGPPQPTDIGFAAYTLYTNYDGNGGHFGSTNARATVSGAGAQAYAAVGSAGQLTIALVNETSAALATTVALPHFAAGAVARYYELGTGSTIVHKADVAVSAGTMGLTLGASAIGMLVVPGAAPATPAMDAPWVAALALLVLLIGASRARSTFRPARR